MSLKINLIEFFPIRESSDYVINKDGIIYRLSNNKFITAKVVYNKYPRVNLVFNGIRVTRVIHRLLAEVFIEKPDGRDYVNHIDGDKTNYDLSNLEWVTRSENMLHSIHVLGNPKPPSHKGRVGKLSKLSKPVKATHCKTGEVLYFDGICDAVRKSENLFHKFGIQQSINGKYTHHQGYVWKYAKGEEIV